jgi:hypothetical protein
MMKQDGETKRSRAIATLVRDEYARRQRRATKARGGRRRRIGESQIG